MEKRSSKDKRFENLIFIPSSNEVLVETVKKAMAQGIIKMLDSTQKPNNKNTSYVSS
jgi:hypothetical protein